MCYAIQGCVLAFKEYYNDHETESLDIDSSPYPSLNSIQKYKANLNVFNDSLSIYFIILLLLNLKDSISVTVSSLAASSASIRDMQRGERERGFSEGSRPPYPAILSVLQPILLVLWELSR
ncbi:hypothetical protein YC2023_012335 [Brassica napus]